MRRFHAFENDPHRGLRSEWQVKSRTFIGQIVSVDAVNGVVRVEVPDTHDSKLANLPLGGLSYAGAGSAWQRHMPLPRAFVRVAYGPRNELEILNYVAYGEDVNPNNGGSSQPSIGGYAQLARAARADEGGLTGFRALNPGEYDLQSSGGAGYYFTAFGRANLYAGTTALALDNARQEAVVEAPLYVFEAGVDASTQRLGTVKRVLTPFALPTAVPPNPASMAASLSPKEWVVDIAEALPGGVEGLRYAKWEAGDIRDALGLPVVSTATTAPLRSRSRWYGIDGGVADGPPVLTVEVDVLGNVAVTQGALGTPVGGLRVTGAAGAPLVTSGYLSQSHEALTSFDITSGAELNLNAGGTADSPILRSAELRTYFETKMQVLTVFGPARVVAPAFVPGVETSLLGKVK